MLKSVIYSVTIYVDTFSFFGNFKRRECLVEYKVTKFFIEKINDKQFYIMNYKSLSNIDDENLIRLLCWIDKSEINEISFEKIRHFMKGKTEKAISFLMEQGILCEINNRVYMKFIYATNDDVIYETVKFNLLENEDDGVALKFNKYTSLERKLKKIRTDSETLLFIILNPFRIDELSKITRLSKDSRRNIRIIFFYNFRFYVTNVYSIELVSPCPMCFFYNLEASLRATNRFEETITFQNIVDMIYSRNAKFTSTAKFNRKQLLDLVAFLKEVQTASTYNDVYELNYETGEVTSDIAYHWELCDCYE